MLMHSSCGYLDHAWLQTHCVVVSTSTELLCHMPAGARDVMLMKLWATVFPVSDKRHPVTTPLALLTSYYLALCPVTCHRDAAIGKSSPHRVQKTKHIAHAAYHIPGPCCVLLHIFFLRESCC